MEAKLNDYITEYKSQLEIGLIPKAYRELIGYVMKLRTHFSNKYADEYTIGSFYQGHMDISFFTVTPLSLKKQKLKIAIVFNHEKIRFEIWLTAQNKQLQKKYWELFKNSDWNKFHIPASLDGGFSIVDSILIDNPDFNDLKSLTTQIEKKVILFTKEITDAICE